MNHYKTLYSEKQVEDVCLNEEIFETFAIKKLSNTEQQQVEGNLTYDKMLNSLKRMRNDSSPGNSGFTTAFYIFFWIYLGHFLVRSVNESFASEELSPTFKQGATCIPKGNKDKMLWSVSIKTRTFASVNTCNGSF